MSVASGGGGKRALGKSGSLPTIIGGKPSPFFDKQALCSVEIRHRRLIREAVGDHQGQGKTTLKPLTKSRMGFMAAERGLEWELNAKAQIPPDPLPPIQDVIKLAIRELDLDFPPQKRSVSLDRESKRDPAFGGSGLHRCGPKLPLNRPRPELDLNTPPPSPPPPPKEPKKKKKPSPKKDAKTVAFAESVLKKLAEPPPPEPEVVVVEEEDDFAEIDIPWSEEELRGVFWKFDSDRDNELEVEDLTPLLRYLGAKPVPQDISKIIKEQMKYHYATIEWEEFLEFIRLFRQHDINVLRQVFKEADNDGSGKLNAGEVESLLRKLGYAPTAQTVHEAMDAVDQDKTGDINFRELEALREYLRQTEGLSMADLQDIRSLYLRAAGCRKVEDKDLKSDEIWRITMFRGYAATAKEIAQITAEVDADGTGTVSFHELLKVIRRVRELERDSIIRVLRSHGDLNGNRLQVKNLGIALSDLGYYVSEEAVWEILESIGDTESLEYLTLEELMAFLRGYRICEGFSQAEMEELEESFNAEDIGRTGSINALELGRVLRSCGFSRTLQKVQRLVEEIDFDGSGQLEMNEFVKLMRQLLQGEARKRREVFQLLDPGRTGKVPVDSITRAVTILDEVEPDKELLQNALQAAIPKGSSAITIGTFEVFYKHYRCSIVEEIRKNAGYGPKEIIQLSSIFASYDRDKSGTIERSELQKLIATYFPDATKSRAQQVEIQKILASFDTGAKTGELDFHKFVWLMRKCDDMRDEADVHMEAEVVKKCGLSVEEVEGFRQIFSSVVSWTGELDIAQIKELLLRVVEFNDDETMELGNIVREVHPHGREVARFPQFIKLVKRLTEDNLLGVNESANRVMRRASIRKQRSTTKNMNEKQQEKVKKEAEKAEKEKVEKGVQDF
jgi:Ca2+-binding EF-hand superfamily protein